MITSKGVAFPKSGGKKYITVVVIPLQFNADKNTTVKTGKQASFQIRNVCEDNVPEIAAYLENAIIEFRKFCTCKKPHDIAGYGKWCNKCSKPIKFKIEKTPRKKRKTWEERMGIKK